MEDIHLCIVGHGMQLNRVFDPGAIGLIEKGEHRYIKEDLIPAMKKYLPKGHKVVFFDQYKVSNYGNIVALAKKYKATQVTELHYDSSPNPEARGGHVIVYEGFAPDKIDLAFRDAINNVVGARKSYNHKGHVGISGRNNLFNVNQMANAGIPYRLLELGFGSGERDSDIMINKVDEYAKELVKAIVGEVKEVDQAAKPKPPTTPKPTPTPEAPKRKQRGVATVTVPTLSLRMAPSVKGKLIRTLKKGESYKVWDERGGWLRLGKDMWASWQDGAYMDWTEKPTKSQSKPNKPAAPRTFSLGQRIKIKSSATKYATGQSIPAQYKNKTYTIQQLKSDRVLIKELLSWVYMKDLA